MDTVTIVLSSGDEFDYLVIAKGGRVVHPMFWSTPSPCKDSVSFMALVTLMLRVAQKQCALPMKMHQEILPFSIPVIL